MMHGKLIVLEGIDGSGKSTQYKCLCDRLSAEGRDFHKLIFPRYDNDSSALIRMYLSGVFGDKPGDVNAYAASTFYAVDRYASYKTDWKDWYENGGLTMADRYTTSNACHQASKLPEAEQVAYFDWLYEFEYGYLQLPKPDLVLYLATTVEQSEARMRQRQADTNTTGDIHEKDLTYLRRSLETGLRAAAHYGWRVINCVENGSMRSIESIHEEIYKTVMEVI